MAGNDLPRGHVTRKPGDIAVVEAANAIKSSPGAVAGSASSRIEIANKVVLSDGREYERSVSIVVAQQ